MICKCGQRLMRHEPTCLNCGEHNRWFETEDQGATGGDEEQIPTFRINDRAADSRDSYCTRASKGITGIHSQMAALRVNEEFKQDASFKKKYARALYPYEPLDDDELKLEVDDLVVILEEIENGWSMAIVNNKRGCVPSSYLQIIDETETSDTSGTRASKGITGIHSQMAALRVNEEFKQDASFKKKHARALYPYEPLDDDELKLEVDDLVVVLDEFGNGWSTAIVNNKRGCVPSNYLQIIDETETSDTSGDLSDFTDDFEDDSEFREVTKDEFLKYVNVLQESGYIALMNELEKTNNEWKDFIIKIAITGESGAGKSTLINALRNLKDDDVGAAKTGCVETTLEPTRYSHPDNKNLELWDLPGVGTPNFTRMTYLKRVHFQHYDFIILVSSTRFTENDTWLAKQIAEQYPSATLFFVRTKIDNDISNIKQGKRSGMTQDEVRNTVLKILNDCRKNLQNAEIGNPHIFVLNSHDVNDFDFGKLSSMLMEKVKSEKRAALALSLSVLSNEVVDEKVKQLKKSIGKTSKCAAMAALHSDREKNEILEIDILQKELIFYQRQLGIDRNSLIILARKFNFNYGTMCRELNFQSYGILQRFETYYNNHDKLRSSKGNPISFIRTLQFQKQCGRLLKNVLNMCIQENRCLQTKIAMWSQEENEKL